jgi:hypothetical protein
LKYDIFDILEEPFCKCHNVPPTQQNNKKEKKVKRGLLGSRRGEKERGRENEKG